MRVKGGKSRIVEILRRLGTTRFLVTMRVSSPSFSLGISEGLNSLLAQVGTLLLPKRGWYPGA